MKDRPDIANWAENYALAGLDPKIGVGIFCHMGRWRKDLDMWRELVTVLLPDGTAVVHRAIGNARAAANTAGGPNFAIEIIRDGSTQRLSFLGGARVQPVIELKDRLLSDGPLERVEFSLLFESDLPMWAPGGGKDSGFAGHGHTEQFGRLVGDIRIGDRVLAFDSFVNRDHSRGPRLTNAFVQHVWFNGALSDGRYFYAYEAQAGDDFRTIFSEACVLEDGEMKPGKLDVGFRLPRTGGLRHIHEPVPFSIDYAGGAVRGRVASFPTTMYHQFTYPWDTYLGARQIGSEENRRMMEQGALYEIDGGVTGYGHIERTIPGRLLEDAEIGQP